MKGATNELAIKSENAHSNTLYYYFRKHSEQISTAMRQLTLKKQKQKNGKEEREERRWEEVGRESRKVGR